MGDGHLKIEQRRVARARRSAECGDSRDSGLVKNDSGDASGDGRVFGIADHKASHIKDRVLHGRESGASVGWSPVLDPHARKMDCRVGPLGLLAMTR